MSVVSLVSDSIWYISFVDSISSVCNVLPKGHILQKFTYLLFRILSMIKMKKINFFPQDGSQ